MCGKKTKQCSKVTEIDAVTVAVAVAGTPI